VKKYYRREESVELRPAHSGMAPILVQQGNLQIQGKVVGVMRQYK